MPRRKNTADCYDVFLRIWRRQEEARQLQEARAAERRQGRSAAGGAGFGGEGAGDPLPEASGDVAGVNGAIPRAVVPPSASPPCTTIP